MYVCNKNVQVFSWFTDNCSDHLDTVFHNLSTKITTITKENKPTTKKTTRKKGKKGKSKIKPDEEF